jgi:molybdenum cofactor synthesis domain-containing protein
MIRVGILTVSDSAVKGLREDRSGPELAKRCDELGWSVRRQAIVEDDCDRIANQLLEWADGGDLSIILTTGGTGIAVRDVTPEGTNAVIEREIPGLAEVIRNEGRKKTKFAALSRGIAGIRGSTLIVNLPGSPRGALESLDAIAELIPHAADLLAGKTEHS